MNMLVETEDQVGARSPRATPCDITPIDPDAALMIRVKHGDLRAFETLVDRYKRPIVNFIYRSLPDSIESEDLAQTVFLNAFKAAHRFCASARFSTWLFTIARHTCLNEIRRRSRHPADSLDALQSEREEHSGWQAEDAAQLPPSELLLNGELETKVREAVAALPERQRTAMLLYTWDDFSYEQIGEILGTSLPAIKSLIHRARETLKQTLKPYLRTGAWGPKNSAFVNLSADEP